LVVTARPTVQWGTAFYYFHRSEDGNGAGVCDVEQLDEQIEAIVYFGPSGYVRRNASDGSEAVAAAAWPNDRTTSAVFSSV